MIGTMQLSNKPTAGTGYLELIIGPMFAGKSSTIMSIVKRYESIRFQVLVVTSAIDTRYAKTAEVINHDFQRMKAMPIERLESVIGLPEYAKAHVIVVEEAQFIPDLYDFVIRAVETDKKHVIVVGLDGDSERKPFGQILELVPLADKIQKLTSYCIQCSDGTPALFSFCTANKSQQISVGATDKYMPLCRKHYLENKHIL